MNGRADTKFLQEFLERLSFTNSEKEIEDERLIRARRRTERNESE